MRWDGAETRRLTRRAPRVALFGITNRCNLTCSFCSRDRDAGSEWTVDGAFDVLAGLARRGLLEVAFGGGEPLAFAGFDELLARLTEQTGLALHFTTNGTLLTERRLRALAPHVGEIRVSVYQDTPCSIRGASPSAGTPDLGALHGTIAQLEAIAQRHGAILAAELAPLPGAVRWPEVLAARPPSADRARLWASFPDAGGAASMADSLDGRAVIAGRYLVMTSARIPARYGFQIQRAGGTAEWMDGGPVRLSVVFWRSREEATNLEPAALRVALRPYLTAEDELATDQEWTRPRATVITGEPGRVLPALVDFARGHGLEMWLDAAPRDRIVAVIARLEDDLARAQRVARTK